MTSRVFKRTVLVLAVACTWASTAALAAPTAFELRAFRLDTAAPFQVSDTVSVEAFDRFNNGNPLNGISYQPLFNGSPNGSATIGSYTSNAGFAPGSERSAPAADFVGTNFGVGGLSFRVGDAIKTTSAVTPAGFDSYSLTLSPQTVAGTALGLVARNASFDLLSVWNASSLQLGESIMLAVSGTGNPNYVDRLQVRFGSNALGNSFLSFEQQSSSNSVISRTTLGSVSLASALGGVKLADVDYIGLNLLRAMPTAANPNPGVRAGVAFFDAALDAEGGLLELGTFQFDVTGTAFQTASANFSGVFTSANWLTTAADVPPAVPEPGTYALMLLGLGGLAAAVKRGRA